MKTMVDSFKVPLSKVGITYRGEVTYLKLVSQLLSSKKSLFSDENPFAQ